MKPLSRLIKLNRLNASILVLGICIPFIHIKFSPPGMTFVFSRSKSTRVSFTATAAILEDWEGKSWERCWRVDSGEEELVMSWTAW